MPLNKMSLLSLERLFRAVVIPSRQANYEFLDVGIGRLVKLWLGVSKFAPTSSLVYAAEWEKASDLVRISHETRTAIGAAATQCVVI